MPERDKPLSELDDLRAGAFVADPDAGCVFEVLDRRERSKGRVVEVKIADIAYDIPDENDSRDDAIPRPDWTNAENLVGLELVRPARVVVRAGR